MPVVSELTASAAKARQKAGRPLKRTVLAAEKASLHIKHYDVFQNNLSVDVGVRGNAHSSNDRVTPTGPHRNITEKKKTLTLDKLCGV